MKIENKKANIGISLYDDHGYTVNDRIEDAMDIFARHIAIDFHDWQKKDQAECFADMSTEDYFDKYLKSKK